MRLLNFLKLTEAGEREPQNKELELMLGIFEEEAFKNPSAVKHLKKYSVAMKIEEHPKASGEVDDLTTWHIHYIKVPETDKQRVISIMQKGMYDGWYSLLQGKDGTHVIFNNGVRIFERGFKAIAKLAAQHELSPEYMRRRLKSGIQELKRVISEAHNPNVKVAP